MGLAKDSAPRHAQMDVRVAVKDVRGVAKTDVAADVKAHVRLHVAASVDKAAKVHATDYVSPTVFQDVHLPVLPDVARRHAGMGVKGAVIQHVQVDAAAVVAEIARETVQAPVAEDVGMAVPVAVVEEICLRHHSDGTGKRRKTRVE